MKSLAVSKSTISRIKKLLHQNHLNVRYLEQTVWRLKAQLRERGHGILCNDVEIAGIPDASGEGIRPYSTRCCQKLGLELEERNIASIEHAGTKHMALESSVSIS